MISYRAGSDLAGLQKYKATCLGGGGGGEWGLATGQGSMQFSFVTYLHGFRRRFAESSSRSTFLDVRLIMECIQLNRTLRERERENRRWTSQHTWRKSGTLLIEDMQQLTTIFLCLHGFTRSFVESSCRSAFVEVN